jgi:hypothetical protein
METRTDFGPSNEFFIFHDPPDLSSASEIVCYLAVTINGHAVLSVITEIA